MNQPTPITQPEFATTKNRLIELLEPCRKNDAHNYVELLFLVSKLCDRLLISDHPCIVIEKIERVDGKWLPGEEPPEEHEFIGVLNEDDGARACSFDGLSYNLVDRDKVIVWYRKLESANVK